MSPDSRLMRGARTSAIAIAVVVGAFLALTKSDATATSAAAADSVDQSTLAVAIEDLVDHFVEAEEVTLATGGYVAGTGAVLTVEVDRLPVDDLEAWASALIAEQSASVEGLPADDQVVLLVDIAEPRRTSRLIALSPHGGTAEVREAPALSTAPLRPIFDDRDGGEGGGGS